MINYVLNLGGCHLQDAGGIKTMIAEMHIDKDELFELLKKKIEDKNPSIYVIEVNPDINWIQQVWEGVKIKVDVKES